MYSQRCNVANPTLQLQRFYVTYPLWEISGAICVGPKLNVVVALPPNLYLARGIPVMCQGALAGKTM